MRWFKCRKFTNSHRLLLSKLKSVKEIDVSNTDFNDKDFTRLKNIKGLEELNLSETKVKNLNINALKSLKELKSINLSKTAVSDQAIKNLQYCPELEHVDIESTKIKVVPEIELWQKIKSLNLSNCNLTRGNTIKSKTLEDLYIRELKIEYLALDTPKLESINYGLRFKGEIRISSDLKYMNSMSFSYRKISPADVKLISHLPNLKELYFSDCDLSILKTLGERQKLESLFINT